MYVCRVSNVAGRAQAVGYVEVEGKWYTRCRQIIRFGEDFIVTSKLSDVKLATKYHTVKSGYQ